MARKHNKDDGVRRKSLIIIAIAVSIILYSAGLLSGFSFSKFVEKKLEAKTAQELSLLTDYVKNLDSVLQSIQLQERFVSSINETDNCQFADFYFSQLSQNLDYFWKALPARLEDYERNINPTPQYLELKRQYTTLSLRAWIISKNNYEKCNSSIIPVLYLYSKNCESCVGQGEELDRAKAFMDAKNKSLVVFTVDSEYPESALSLIKEYYGIKQLPALIVNNKLLEGRLFSQNEIMLSLKEETVREVFQE